MRARNILLCLLIFSACLFTACDLNRTQTFVLTPVSVSLTPAISVQALPYPVATPVYTQSILPYPEPKMPVITPSVFPYPEPKKTTLAEATRNAFDTALSETLTAMPTATPTPTFPVDALPCHASDLQISARTEGYPTHLAFFVKITNTSSTTCYLQGPPDIKLIDRNGTILDLEYVSFCIGCKLVGVAALTQTAIVQETLYNRIGIGANEQVGVKVNWVNWCEHYFPEGGVLVRLTLPDELGMVAGPTDAYVGGPCRFPDRKSQLEVGYYYHTQ